QELEGHRVTVFGTRSAVPGVVAVRSTHLTRGRVATGAPDPVFTVDNAYVDVGASSAAEVQALGIAVLAPVSLAKRPQLHGERWAPQRGCLPRYRSTIFPPKIPFESRRRKPYSPR